MIQSFEVTFGYPNHILFENVTFSLNKNEKLGLIGRNGSGKSTLLKLILGFEKPSSGRFIIPKDYTIGYLDQHIHFTKEIVLEEAVTALKTQDGSLDYLAKMILIGLGFSEENLYQKISSFSGGYQLRLHLAKALLKKPDLLLLDEPTNYLDILSIQWLKGYLKNYPGELILITHDRNFMDEVTSSIIGLHRGKIKKVEGKTQDYFLKVLEEEEQFEKTRQNLEKQKQHLEGFINRFGAKATKAKQAQSKRKQLEKIPVLEKLNALEHLNFAFNDKPINSMKIKELHDVSFFYSDDKPLINHVSLEIMKGEKVAIIGKNGFGKSTLLKLMGGFLNPKSGVIKDAPNLEVGYFGQTNIQTLNPSFSVLEEIKSSSGKLTDEEARSICGSMLFSSSAMDKKIAMLSGGEKSRVLLGKILAKSVNLVLLDEPTHHLDMESIEALIEAVDTSESAFVIVTHSEDVLKRLPLDKLVYCQEGIQKVFLGDYQEFFEKNPSFFVAEKNEAEKPKEKNLKNSYAESKELQSEMKKVEKKIIQLEEELKKIDHLILLTSEQGRIVSPKDLKRKKEIEEEIELKFAEMELIYNKLNNI